MEADQLGRLHDILEAARLIARYVADTSRRHSLPIRRSRMP